MVKGGKWEISTVEFERQYTQATKRGEELIASEPQAKQVYYNSINHQLVIELKSGVILFVPCTLIPALANASPQEIADVELLPYGAALTWELLDVQLSVAGLLVGNFGPNLPQTAEDFLNPYYFETVIENA